MIPLIPYQRITITSQASPEKNKHQILKAVLDPMASTKQGKRTNKKYVGVVNGTNFKIHKRSTLRTLCSPMMFGRCIPTETGTKVIIHITFHPIILGIIILWYLDAVRQLIFGYNEIISFNPPFFWIVTGLCILSYVATIYYFWKESKEATQLISEIFVE